ncbi:DUF2059 domain-containing protein [uncultured Roseobacter sp.]|uniref:DUF2059 domain-containing protein n=1 Tax=uncultured Roseobacter sp. TaxID=114847 RepID=UPI0026081B1D|nr:DUF2059 domain-containing protein [uncultured Roseobacter sp.]
MRFLNIFFIVAFAGMASAQDAAQLQAAKGFVDSAGQQAVLDKMLSVERVLSQTGLTPDKIPDGKEPVIREIIAEELGQIRPALEKEMSETAAEVYTAEEIAALTAFYNSDAGASAVAKTELFQTLTLRSFGPTFREARQRMAERLQAELAN